MSSNSTDNGGSSDNIALEEWKEIRSVFARLDEDLHDLRKYGLVFLASLLSVDSFQVYFSLPLFTRTMLLIITLAFIVSLRLMDHNYQKLQSAVLIRSRILEVNLNIELSETIAMHYRRRRFPNFVSSLYYGFVAITILLGIAILFPITSFNQIRTSPSVPYFIGFLIAVVIGIILLVMISTDLRISPQRLYDKDANDWTLDRVSCKKGEDVKITVTNLGRKTVFPEGSTAFVIKNDEKYLREVKVNKEIVLWRFQNYSWVWNTGDADADKIYKVIPIGRMNVNGGEFPLKRTILVYPSDSQQKSKQQNQKPTYKET